MKLFRLYFCGVQVEQMKEEFLKLTPMDRMWGSDELLVDPLVLKRRGSTDVLNPRRMKTTITTTPESETRFQLRFDLTGFIPASIKVTGDRDRLVVRAIKYEKLPDHSACPIPTIAAPAYGRSNFTTPVHAEEFDGTGPGAVDTSQSFMWKEYCRKIEKPKEVDHTKLKAHLSSDGILLIQATMTSLASHFMSKSDSLPLKAATGPSPSPSFQVRRIHCKFELKTFCVVNDY